jgi:hypothetical protein
MKLWLISQSKEKGYDTYDSAIVAAETEEEARKTPPSEYYIWVDGILRRPKNPEQEISYPCWATKIEDVTVAFLGEAAPDTKPGVICASFNAG